MTLFVVTAQAQNGGSPLAAAQNQQSSAMPWWNKVILALGVGSALYLRYCKYSYDKKQEENLRNEVQRLREELQAAQNGWSRSKQRITFLEDLNRLSKGSDKRQIELSKQQALDDFSYLARNPRTPSILLGLTCSAILCTNQYEIDEPQDYRRHRDGWVTRAAEMGVFSNLLRGGWLQPNRAHLHNGQGLVVLNRARAWDER